MLKRLTKLPQVLGLTFDQITDGTWASMAFNALTALDRDVVLAVCSQFIMAMIEGALAIKAE